MTAALTPLRGARVRWFTILGLLLVPLTVAGVFLWGLWNPSERLDTVTAAVVNNDEPVEVDGQLVPLGRVLAAELIAGDADTNFTWVLTNAEDAEDGLADGRYATSVTIPKNFSAAATSLAGGPEKAERATIRVAESEQGKLLDTALSGIVTQTATRVLNQQLGEQFVGNVFVGMSTLHDGISEAAGGAHKLAQGGTQLADGTQKLADGVGEYRSGVDQFASGVSQLSDGAGQLASGARDLSNGAGELTSGADQLANGATGLASGAQELAQGTRDSANGGAQLADGVEAYTGSVNGILDQVIGGAGMAVEPLQQLRGVVEGLPDELFPPEQSKASVLAMLDQALAEVTNAANGSDESAVVQLRNAGAQLAAGARASADGQAELATGAEDFAAGVGAYAKGATQYSSGVTQFADGAAQLSDGASQLAANTPALETGAQQLASGAGELQSGADQLAEGSAASAKGAGDLADGLDQAAAGIPNYSEQEREVMASTAVEGVRAEGGSDELFNGAGVPLFAGIALWAGALAAFLVLSSLWGRTRDAARGVFAITMRSALPALALGAAQGAIAGIVLPLALGYTFAQTASFFWLALVAGIAFALVVQGLSARFGGFGRFIAFVIMVIAFVVGIVSTVPGPLAAIGQASPIGAAFAGFQSIAFELSSGGGSIALLALWALAGLALTAWAVMRARRAKG